MDWTLLFLTLLGLCSADSDIKCDASQHLVPDCRQPCPPERTCQNKDGPEPPCVPPMGPCKMQCVCAEGYAKNQYGGYCVTYAQCDQCKGNNQYFACDGPYSENCTGSCYCTSGYARDANGTCVSSTPPLVDTHPPPPPPPINPSPPTGGAEPSCPPGPELSCDNATRHEIPGCIHGCPPERTCQNRNWPPLPCAPPAFPCTPKCICDDGYARNQPTDGDCITFEQCDLCPGENEYFQCDGKNDVDCEGHCYCYSGHVRDINDKCTYVDPASRPYNPPIPTEPTPAPALYCDNATRHEVPACTFGCPPEKTCQNRHWPPPSCAPPAPWLKCTHKCICDHGYVRNEPRGVCITEKQCDKCSGENEYFQCDGTNDGDCDGRCYCFSGYVRDKEGKCVYVDPAAPPKILVPPATTTAAPEPQDPELICNATRHEVLCCKHVCPRERTCQDRDSPRTTCPPPTDQCKQKCVCDVGYIRNEPNGVCIPLEQCDLQCDPAKHETPACVYPCPPERTCQNFRDPQPPCQPMNPHVCKPTCVCASGYARNRDTGTCVTTEQCDKCPGLSQYFACDGPYSETCKGSCHCATGYERDGNNTCVSTNPTEPCD